MKKIFILLPLLFFGALLFIGLGGKAYAQGTYSCRWSPEINTCGIFLPQCQADYKPGDCSQYTTQKECEQTRECVKKEALPSPLPTPTPALTISPETGSSNTLFTLRASGFPNSGKYYKVCAYPPSGAFVVLDTTTLGLPGPNFSVSFSGVNFAFRQIESWTIKVFERSFCPQDGSGNIGPTVSFRVSSIIKPPNIGEACDPDFQNRQEFKCPLGSICELVGATIAGPYICKGTPTPTPPPPPCAEWSGTGTTSACLKVATGLGIEIGTNPQEFVKSIFGILLGLSGGIALLLIIVSGYQMMVSQGNPEKLQGAKETLTSAIVGLLFIIFSIVILQIIGVDILKIPGFK